jgi:hypothetical protein
MAPPPVLPSLAGAGLVRDVGEYLSPHSDIVALLVLEHQLHADNLMTRAGWEYRLAMYPRVEGTAAGDAAATGPLPARVADAVDELADYLLFVDEVPLGTVKGASGFAEWFAAQGPRDPAGRSLRELKLDGRLLRYPLSFMVYSTAFETLPAAVKTAVYRRLGQVLSERDSAPKYAHLARADRQAIVEILRATKPELPGSFTAAAPAGR